MEVLWNGVSMENGVFRLGTDSVALAWFADFPKGSRVCDLGCGSGAISLMLLASDRSLQITGIELMPEAAELAKQNAAKNGLPFTVIEGDLRNIHEFLPTGSMDGVISNPPYFPVGSGFAAKGPLSAARSEETCNLKQLTQAMNWLLKTGGRAFLVHRPERLADLIWHLKNDRLEPKRIRFVRHRQESPVSLVLLEARKGGKPGLTYEQDLLLFDDEGETKEYQSMYHRTEQNRSNTMAGMLYLVPTPIGNLGDISQRCRETLEQADFIAAEDTRVSLKLLNHLNIKKPLVSYYEHNREISGQKILDRILAGETCALVSDAGSPAISDPGEDLVALCAQNGVVVSAIPGPCAAITALSISGLPTGRFTFEGFLSTNKKSRQEHLDSLIGEQRTMIFYEAPHKLTNTLDDLIHAFGPDRRISLCRELTKLHEEVIRTTLQGAADYYKEQSPRGEYVLILEGAEPPAEEGISMKDALKLVEQKLASGLSKKDAVKQTAKETGIAKNTLYDEAMKL